MLEGDLVAGGVEEAEDPRDQGLVHHLRVAEEIAVRLAMLAGGQDEPRGHADLPPDLHGPLLLLLLGSDQDVREDVVPGDDPAEGFSEHSCPFEDALEQLRIVCPLEHGE